MTGAVSRQSDVVRRHWVAAAEAIAATAGRRDDAPATDDEAWGYLTAEPGGVDYLEVEPNGQAAWWLLPRQCAADRVVVCLHGGGFVSGSVHTHRKLFAHLAKAAGVRGLVVGYPTAPGRTHPAQVDAVTDAYRWLLDQGVRAQHVAFAGDSAGGALAITVQLRARERGLPLPAAAMPFSPWVDLLARGHSYTPNHDRDPLFRAEFVRGLAATFLGPQGDPADPLASPLHADLRGLGPLYIQVGGDEALLDDAQRLAAYARRAGVEVRIDVFPGMLHTFQMAAGRAPEADDAIRRMAAWLRPRIGLSHAPALTGGNGRP